LAAALTDPPSGPGSRIGKAAIGFIMVTVTLDLLAMSVIVPVLPKLVLSMEGGRMVTAAHVIGVFGTAWALMQFVFSPVQGALSDSFGRRPVILLSNFGLGINYILMAVAPGIGLLFVGRVVSGICAASFSTANAYIADITPPERRAGRYGLLSIAFGFGFVVGPALGGALGSIDPRLPFWVSGALSLINGLFGLFILPESLPSDCRVPFSLKRANPLGSLALLRSRPGLLGLAAILFLYALAQNALPVITVLYTTSRYAWDTASVGYMLAGFGVASAIVGGGLTGRVVKRLGERAALLVGLGFGVAGFAVMGAARTGALFLVGIPILALESFASPALTGLMSREVGGGEQGQLAGANSSIMAIASLLGPTIYTGSFAYAAAGPSNATVAGAPFLIAAALVACGLLAGLRHLSAQAPAPVSETVPTDR
jgi:DHA1 family tetracycline resistance protein-like MFS transporter